MYQRVTFAAVLATLLLCAIVTADAADDDAKKPTVGDVAPSFEALPGTDGKNHSFSDYKEAKALVICFTCNTCPIAAAYEARFIEFTKTYKDKGVEFIAINVHDSEEDKMESLQERAAKKGFNFDYLRDVSQESARAYSAKVTPHLFVLDKNRKISYIGKFDDSFNPNKVKTQYVRDAVDSLLAGKPVEVSETKAIGCGIRYESN